MRAAKFDYKLWRQKPKELNTHHQTSQFHHRQQNNFYLIFLIQIKLINDQEGRRRHQATQ
jgi:hypothetical protein